MHFNIRPATRDDVDAIEAVMRRSLATLGRPAYDEEQVASAIRHTAHLDVTMIDDGTYFVAVDGAGTIIGCGGWSRREKLFRGSAEQEDDAKVRLLDPATEAARVRAMFVDPAWSRRGIGREILLRAENAARAEGFRRTILMAMLSGERLYVACGYTSVEPAIIETPDGVALPCIVMEKPL